MPSRSIAVVGGGISAAQVALEHASRGHRVDLISRHAVRLRQYDCDPGWFGPKFMDDFDQLESLAERRRAITRARHRGSMPADVRSSLLAATDAGRVIQHFGRVEDLVLGEDHLQLRLEGRALGVDVDELVLATGYAPWRPGGELVAALAARAPLPLSPCGYPVVDRALRWHPRIHVTGSLAELELGPIARNIAGARRAADRILASTNS